MPTPTANSALPQHDIRVSAVDGELSIACWPCRWEIFLENSEPTIQQLDDLAKQHRNGLENIIIVPFKYTEKERHDARAYPQ